MGRDGKAEQWRSREEGRLGEWDKVWGKVKEKNGAGAGMGLRIELEQSGKLSGCIMGTGKG